MFPSNRGYCKDSEEPTPAQQSHPQTNMFIIHGQHLASPSLLSDDRHSQVQHILNKAAPMRPFSFLSLLTAPENEDDMDPLSKDIKDQREQIDQMIQLHSEKLRQELGSMLEKHHHDVHFTAEEHLAEKMKARELELKAQNSELERMVEHYMGEAEHYKGQAQQLTIRLGNLEQETRSLNARLRNANAFHCHVEEVPDEAQMEDEAESSFNDPNPLGPIMLECKVCVRQLATLMLWPCRHVCLCTNCEAITKFCPVCRSYKTNSIEVQIPLN